MRRIMMTLGSAAVVLGSSLIAAGQDKVPAPAPTQASAKQAPQQAPLQAPTQKLAPVQAPHQAPTQKHVQGPTQSPVQKGGKPVASRESDSDRPAFATARPGIFRRR
jgi:hypothetical protein